MFSVGLDSSTSGCSLVYSLAQVTARPFRTAFEARLNAAALSAFRDIVNRYRLFE